MLYRDGFNGKSDPKDDLVDLLNLSWGSLSIQLLDLDGDLVRAVEACSFDDILDFLYVIQRTDSIQRRVDFVVVTCSRFREISLRIFYLRLATTRLTVSDSTSNLSILASMNLLMSS